MSDGRIIVRHYASDDGPGVVELVRAHMQEDQHWPPRHARTAQDLDEWLAARSDVGRWVASDDGIIGHVGVSTVPEGPKADGWTAALRCRTERLAEIGRLIVHPNRRRSGVSELLTRRCVRDTVAAGYIPVASALLSSEASRSMMLGFGWRMIGEVTGRRSGSRILLLIAPEKLVLAALERNQSDSET